MSNGSPHPPAAPCAARNILGRWLHFGIAVCVVLCLVLASLAGAATRNGPTLGGTVAFNLHKFIGLNALLLGGIFLVWSALGHARAPGELFPWFSARRLAAIARELRRLDARLHLPATAAMVQGCGVGAALVAASTGMALVLLSLAAQATGHGPVPAGSLLRWHLAADTVLWTYLALHVLAALLHAARGQAERLARMFRLLHPE